MKKISVPYGEREQTCFVDDGIDVRVIEKEGSKPEKSLTELLKEAMETPIGSKPLEKIAKPGDKVSVIVNDQTRPTPTEEMLGEIIPRLHKAGVQDGDITIVVATGTHRAPTAAEQEKMFGKDNVSRFRIVPHDCMADEDLRYIGETKSGLPLYINKWVAESDVRIATGLIAPHHCAGYSGGRKSIIPGVAGMKTLRLHHSFPIFPYEPAIGFIDQNPFHETAVEAALSAGVHFIVNSVQDCHKNTVRFVAGDLLEAHRAGVALCEEMSVVELDKRADVIITSPGGFPRDIDLYQGQKAVSVAEQVSNDGCIFILCSESRDGFGEGEFRQWMVDGASAEAIIKRFADEGFTTGSNKAFLYSRALVKGRVIVVTDRISGEELEAAKLEWAPDLQAVFLLIAGGCSSTRDVSALESAPPAAAETQAPAGAPVPAEKEPSVTLPEKTAEEPYPLPVLTGDALNAQDVTVEMMNAIVQRFCHDLFDACRTLEVPDFSPYIEDNESTHLAFRWPEFYIQEISSYPGYQLVSAASVETGEGELRVNGDSIQYRTMCEVRFERADLGVNGCNVDVLIEAAERQGSLKIVKMELVFDSRYRDLLARLEEEAQEAPIAVERIDELFDELLNR